MPRIPDYSDYEYDIVEELRKDHTTVTGYRPSDSEILRTSQQETYARSRTRPGAVSGALANSELSFSANHVRGPELVDAVGQESADRYVAMASAHERRAISFARDVETMMDDYNGQHSMALFLRYSPEDLQWFARQTGTTDQFAGHIETLINLRKTEGEWRRTRAEETDRILKDSV